MNIKKLMIGAAAILVIGGTVISCKKDKVTTPVITPPDPIGGFDSSNAVGAANLKAHWTFDGTYNEVLSSTAPVVTVAASFTTGMKGQALMLDSGFLAFPTIPALNVANLGSVTVSCWIKVANNGNHPSNAFGLTQDAATQTDWNTGGLNMLIETGDPIATNDTLVLHPDFNTYATGSVSHQDNINNGDPLRREIDYKTVHGSGVWVHYVMRYDGSTSNCDILANGIVVSNVTYRHRQINGVDAGPLVIPTPSQVLIGALPNATTGFPNSAAQSWQGYYIGAIDEIRFWNTALSDADISSLYQLEKVGR